MDLGAEMTVEESINLQVLHWATPLCLHFEVRKFVKYDTN